MPTVYNMRAKLSQRKLKKKILRVPIKFHRNSLIFSGTKEIPEKSWLPMLFQEVDILFNNTTTYTRIISFNQFTILTVRAALLVKYCCFYIRYISYLHGCDTRVIDADHDSSIHGIRRVNKARALSRLFARSTIFHFTRERERHKARKSR